jgi:hypothetical protein
MPEVVELQALRTRRAHRSTRPPLLSVRSLDLRSTARKAFDSLCAAVHADLGGASELSTIESALVEAFVGSVILLDGLNARLLLGDHIELSQHAHSVAALTRVASRLGLQRWARDITPDPLAYARERSDNDGEAVS